LGATIEDQNDDGLLGGTEETLAVNGRLDGDRQLGLTGDPTQSDPFTDPNPTNHDGYVFLEGSTGLATTLSPMDVDQDGLVEDPRDTTGTEYTKAHALKHTITHELGHLVGIDHNAFVDTLMSGVSNNWIRDEFFAPQPTVELEFINIHNGN